MTKIERPSTPNTFLAGPAGMRPKPDQVTPAQDLPAPALYEKARIGVRRPTADLCRGGISGQRQVHYVVRSAMLNFPDLVTVQVDPAGADRATLIIWSRSVYGRSDLGVNRKRTESLARRLATIHWRDDQTMGGVGLFLKDAWRLARPYFVESEERWSARGLLAAVIALSLASVGLSVLLNFWRLEFYNAIQSKDWDGFVSLLLLYRITTKGLTFGFTPLAMSHVVIAVFEVYLTQWLTIRWRRWMTDTFPATNGCPIAPITRSASLGSHELGTDNPDQRITEDIRDYCDTSLSLTLGLISRVVTLFSFLTILWGLSDAFDLFGVSIPGDLFWIALVYSIVGTICTHIDRPPAGRADVPPAAGRSGFPLFAGAGPGKRRGHRAVSRRGAGESQPAASLPGGDRQFLCDHASDHAAEHGHRRLQPDRGDHSAWSRPRRGISPARCRWA